MPVINGIFFVAILIIDGKALVDWWLGGDLLEAVGLHFIACGAMFFQIRWSLPSRVEGRVFAAWMLPVMLLFPFLGLAFAGGTALAIGRGASGKQDGGRYVSLSEVMAGDEDAVPSYGSAVVTIPEIMWGSDVEARRRAVHALRGLEPVDSLPILRRLAQDNDEFVRLFALAERRRIVSEFEEKVRALEEKREEGGVTVSDLVYLAETRIGEVEAGLPADARQRDAILERAMDALHEAVVREPGRTDVDLTTLRCVLLLGNAEQAVRVLERMESTGRAGEALAIPRCEVYFLLGEWEKLVDCLRNLPESLKQGVHFEKVLSLWVAGKQRREAK